MQKEEILEEQKIIEEKKTISVHILWFSVLADHRGKRTEQLSLHEGSRGSDLIDRLSAEMPIVRKYRDYIRLAVNQEYVDVSHALHHGDEIALITPVSGG